MRSRLFVVARYVVGLLLIYWLTRSGIVDWSAVRDRLRAWPLLLAPFAFLVLSLVAMSWRLVELLRGRGFTITLFDAFRLSLVGTLFNLVLPAGGGDVARFWYASASAAGRRTEIATILLLDRVIGLMTLLASPLIVLPLVWSTISGSAVLTSVVVFAALVDLGVICGFTLILAPRDGVIAPLAWLLGRLPYQTHVRLFVDTLRGYRHHTGALARATLASFVTHGLTAIAVVLLYLHGGAGSPALVGMVSLQGFVANSLPLTPGGIGVGEAAFEALFREAGLSGGAEALLSWRILLIALAPAGLLVHLRGLRITLATNSR